MFSSIPGGPWTLAKLEAAFPWAKWREPQQVILVGDDAPHFACRVCVATHGLTGTQVLDLPGDPEVVRQHIAELADRPHTEHPRVI